MSGSSLRSSFLTLEMKRQPRVNVALKFGVPGRPHAVTPRRRRDAALVAHVAGAVVVVEGSGLPVLQHGGAEDREVDDPVVAEAPRVGEPGVDAARLDRPDVLVGGDGVTVVGEPERAERVAVDQAADSGVAVFRHRP